MRIIVIFTAVACFCSFFVKSLLNFARAGLGLSVPFFIIVIVTMFFPKQATKHFPVAVMIASYVAMVIVSIIPAVKAFFGDAVWCLTAVGIVATVIVLIVDRKNPAYFQTEEFQNAKGSLYEKGTKDYEKDPFKKKI